MNDEYLSIASEITELQGLLASLPESSVIERISLESRLASAQAALAAMPDLPQQPASKARLTFRGKPVLGSHGIAADFASKATGAFADAFAAVAAGLNEGLRDSGPIPNRDRNTLLITGTAVGSFGFEFELPAAERPLFPDLDQSHEAMARIEALFRLAAEGTDDEVAEVIEEVHPRAVRKVHEFLELLVQQQAWCGLEYSDRHFRYADHGQIKASCERLKDDNIREHEETYRGEFQGVLPKGRAFEFRVAADQYGQPGVIKGKVDHAIGDVGLLNREWLYRPVTATFKVMRVGQGRPRFTLMSLDDLHP